MIKKQLYIDLFDKITSQTNIVIFGANITGEKILKDLLNIKPNNKILGFIDNNVKGSFQGFPVWSLKEFVDKKQKNVTVLMSTTNDQNVTINILDLFDIPVIKQTEFVSNYYRSNLSIFNDERFNKAVEIFDKTEDKELFQNIVKTRIKILEPDFYKHHYYTNVAQKYKTNRVFRKQYLEKINKNAIKTVFDAGAYDGINVIAFNKLLPNVEKIYGFEAIYDITRNPYIEQFLPKDKFEIIPFALGAKNQKINFYINKSFAWCSFGEDITEKTLPQDSDEWNCRIVDVTTIDTFCNDKNIMPDFIKMDIEGAELSALKGGIETIKKCRPQLAISIYHQAGKDLITIPLYLKENLENYKFRLGHYSETSSETVFYAIPNELA